MVGTLRFAHPTGQQLLSKQDETGNSTPPSQPSNHGDDDGSRPIPGSVLAMIMAILVVVLVLGYLFVNKLADISHQEDCVLAHRRNC
jgi:hypothetical protein